MKIRTRLKLNTLISVGTFIIMLVALAWSFFDSSRTYRDLTMIDELQKVAAERVMLRDDYLLHREERAKIQWQVKSETIRGLLDMADARFAHREDKALLKEARKAFEATFTSFTKFLDEHKRKEHAADKTLNFTDAEARLISQVFLKAYILSDNIAQLHETAQKKARAARERGVLIIVLFIVGGVVTVIFNTPFIGILLGRKIAALIAGVGIIGNGNLDFRIEATGDDELSGLSRTINEMTARLKQSYTSVENLQKEISERKKAEEDIKRLSSHQHVLISAIPDIIMEVDINKIYTWANEPGIDFFGKDVIGKAADFYFIREQNIYDVVQPIFNGNEDVIYLESWQKRKDGQERLLAWWCRVLKDAQGNVTGALSSARDVTEHKLAEEEIKRLTEELERRVIERTTQLEAVNKELETFSYSVSHDLRAPLRSIDGFSLALLEDYQKILDDKGRNYLERIRKATQHMGNLIDDMLKLSRVTQSEFNYQSVDLSKIVQSISDTFQKNNPNNNVKMTIQKGIVIQGDPHSMQIALTNLIDNAWKFTGKQKHPRIEFGATLKENEKIFFIRDNGVGFDMSYVGKLFGAFQRLHTIDEFAGTGIGLATVQRIIRRHGGKIWAEGEVGKGATFFFTIP